MRLTHGILPRLVALLIVSPGGIMSAHGQPACRPIGEPLRMLEGEWAVEWSYRLAPENWLNTRGSAAMTHDLYGCVLTERFTSAIDTIPYTRITAISEPRAGEYDRTTVDSQHGGILLHSGTASGDTITFIWQRDIGGRLIRTRHLYILKPPDRLDTEFYLSRAPGEAWELRQKATYTRVKPRG